MQDIVLRDSVIANKVEQPMETTIADIGSFYSTLTSTFLIV